jgi:hypothetical protein
MGGWEVVGIASGGGAIAELEGDEYLIAHFNDPNAPLQFGCIDMYYTPLGQTYRGTVDLLTVQECHDCVDAVRTAKADLDIFMWETSLQLGNTPIENPITLENRLKEKEYRLSITTKADPAEQANVKATKANMTAKLVQLNQLRINCDTALAGLLEARDRVITPAPPPEPR